jgi:hypothetical protein
MGQQPVKRSVSQTTRRAALGAQAGHRRERQERDRRIDALAADVLVPRSTRCCRTPRRAAAEDQATTKLALRQAVAWLGGNITAVAGPGSFSSRNHPSHKVVRVSGRSVDRAGLAALDRALAGAGPVPVEDR